MRRSLALGLCDLNLKIESMIIYSTLLNFLSLIPEAGKYIREAIRATLRFSYESSLFISPVSCLCRIRKEIHLVF
jgi:hypothetical protein